MTQQSLKPISPKFSSEHIFRAHTKKHSLFFLLSQPLVELLKSSKILFFFLKFCLRFKGCVIFLFIASILRSHRNLSFPLKIHYFLYNHIISWHFFERVSAGGDEEWKNKQQSHIFRSPFFHVPHTKRRGFRENENRSKLVEFFSSKKSSLKSKDRISSVGKGTACTPLRTWTCIS